MDKIVKWLDGKKAYITAAITFVCGGLEASGYHIPEYVYAILGGLGLTFIRTAVSKIPPPSAPAV